jgi:hypothetical protein
VGPARGVFSALMSRKPGVTVNVNGLLVTPSAEAVTCVVPGSKAVTLPVPGSIEATAGALLVQVKVMRCRMFPCVSFAVAENWAVPLTATEDEVDVTVIEAILLVEPQPTARHAGRKRIAKGNWENLDWVCIGALGYDPILAFLASQILKFHGPLHEK